MANKNAIEVANQQAELVVNNAFIDGLTNQLTEKMKYGLTFPTGYNYSNELLGAYLTLKETKDRNGKCVLESCSQPSIANCLMEMAVQGLSMQRKQCYAISYGSKLQLITSVFGNTAIARNYGLLSIDATVIYEGDEFEFHVEGARKVIDKHIQKLENIDNNKIVAAYAVAKMRDGSVYVEIMNLNMIKQAWQQGSGYRENGSGVHQKFTDQMCEKTVKNRLLKKINRTYGTQETSDFMDKMDEYDESDVMADVTKSEIEENANTEEFVPEVMEGEVIVEEVTEDIPDFMR